ncbi:MAG: hypothetical protein NTZ56_20165 [Acidobacteria bacterium]|nr:hypothetical protein [Acidobacteriota bacterium]
MKRYNVALVGLLFATALFAQTDQSTISESRVQPLAAMGTQVFPQAIELQGFEYVVPELIIGGEWTTTIKLTNRGRTAIPPTNVLFIDNNGNPLLATFQTSSGNTVTDSGFSFSLSIGGIIEIPFTGTSTVRFGYATVACNANGCGTPGLYGEATLRNRNPTRPADFESVFPLEAPATLQYMLFDGRAGFTTVLYLVNSSPSSQTVTLDVFDNRNNILRTVPIPMGRQTSQILSLHGDLAPETVGIQGTLRIRSAGPSVFVTVTGLRINPLNSFTPIRAFVPSN